MNKAKEWKENFRKLLLDRSIIGGDSIEAQSIKYLNIPTKLFKYCDFSDHNKNNLNNNIVWLTSAENFNDPYDCSLTYSNEALLNRKIEEYGINFLFKNANLGKFTFTKDEEIEIMHSTNKIRKIIEIMLPKDTELDKNTKTRFPSIVIEAIEEFQRPLAKANRSKTFVSCFSETNKSIIMWSHYACKHKGFCIEYNVKDDNSNVYFYPIFYEKKLFDLTKYLLTNKEEFNDFALLIACLTKSKEWEYEKEWRLIPYRVVDKQSEWSMPKPTALYIGAKATDNDKKWIKNIAHSKNIDLYQAKIDDKEFRIKFEFNRDIS
jgi:hypothetical protein